jgi:hypothetical protein
MSHASCISGVSVDVRVVELDWEQIGDARAVAEEPVACPFHLWRWLLSCAAQASWSSGGSFVDRGAQTLGEVSVAIHADLETRMFGAIIDEVSAQARDQGGVGQATPWMFGVARRLEFADRVVVVCGQPGFGDRAQRGSLPDDEVTPGDEGRKARDCPWRVPCCGGCPARCRLSDNRAEQSGRQLNHAAARAPLGPRIYAERETNAKVRHLCGAMPRQLPSEGVTDGWWFQ